MLVNIGICFKQHIDTRYFAFYNPSPPRMFLPLDLLSEYRIQHGIIEPIYVTPSYSTWIFYRGVSCFAIDCPCGVWCRGLITCSLYAYPHFKQPLGCRFDIMDCKSSFCWILTYAIVYVLWHHLIFRRYLYILNGVLYLLLSTQTFSIDVLFILSVKWTVSKVISCRSSKGVSTVFYAVGGYRIVSLYRNLSSFS